MRLKAWAKVNLTLSVQGVRADGYHLLHSYAVSVDVGDEVEVVPDDSGVIRLMIHGSPQVPQGSDNLAWKAAARLQALRPHAPPGAVIRLRKAIPAGAGMGGASADAAAVLIALNDLWGLGLGPEELTEIGLSLGADVPFCLNGGAALVEGIGERLTPLVPSSPLFMVRVTPPVSLSTRVVFQTYDEIGGCSGTAARRREPVSLHEFLRGWREGASGLARLLHNDLEAAAARLAPEVLEVKRALLVHGAAGAVMSGSGPTVIGLAHDASHAGRLARAVQRPGWDVQPVGLRPRGVERMDEEP